jgi:hypothetical protein
MQSPAVAADVLCLPNVKTDLIWVGCRFLDASSLKHVPLKRALHSAAAESQHVQQLGERLMQDSLVQEQCKSTCEIAKSPPVKTRTPTTVTVSH